MRNEHNSLKVIPHSKLLIDTTQPPLDIIGYGILPQQSLLLITGKPKSRKSFFAMNLAIAISQGESFAGFSIPTANKVLFLSAEGGYYSNKKRIDRLGKRWNVVGDDNLFWAFDARLNLTDDSDILKIVKKIKEFNCKVLVIDPFIRFHDANENSANEMGLVFKQIQSLMIESSCTVILIHHTGKDARAGARGSSVINGEYDSEITIQKSSNGYDHTISFDLRHAESPSKRLIYFNKNNFWFHESDSSYEILSLIPPCGITKTDLIKSIVDKSICKRSTAYTKINENIKEGTIKEKKGKLFRVLE